MITVILLVFFAYLMSSLLISLFTSYCFKLQLKNIKEKSSLKNVDVQIIIESNNYPICYIFINERNISNLKGDEYISFLIQYDIKDKDLAKLKDYVYQLSNRFFYKHNHDKVYGELFSYKL